MALEDLIKSRSSNASLEPPSGSVDGFCRSLLGGPQTADEQTSEGYSNEANPRSVSEPDAKGQDGGRNRPSDEGLAGPTDLPPGVQEEGVAESQIPRGVCEVVTPSGVQIYYQAAPKRLYKVNGKEVPSVTGVLDILEKGGLPWWGMKVGIEGVLQLSNADNLALYSTVEEWVELLTQHKLTVNHVRDQAGDRGQAVHDALELWASGNYVLPEPLIYAPEEQGYVRGLRDFLIDCGAEAVASEVMVGSAKHKYAGRFDLRARIPHDTDVVVKTYPVRKPLRGRLEGGEWLLDLKTSKGVYDTHYLQLEAYETASIECGYEPTIQRGVIHVTEDGRYELAVSKATFTDFKAVLSAYKRLQALKAR